MQADYGLYLILNAAADQPQAALALLEQVVAAGITCVQLRMKATAPAAMVQLSKKILRLLQPYAIPLIINDCVEVALLSGAQGVHLGQRDGDYLHARARLGRESIIGLSIENNAQAQAYQRAEVNYFGVGPVFTTSSKSDAAAPLGLENLKIINKILPQPSVAIGGIDETNIAAVLQTGVTGVAVIAAIAGARAPALAARALAQQIRQHREN